MPTSPGTDLIRAADKSGMPAPLYSESKWKFEGDATDILIPKILLAQSTSKAVQDEKVSFGQLYKSTTFEVLGGKDKPVSIIPLYHTKTWVLSQKVGGKYEFRAVEPFTAENKDKPWEFTQVGQEWKREQSLNFFVLIPTEIEKDLAAREQAAQGEIPDLDASLLPAVLSFKSTSYKSGKTLVTHFAKASDFGLPPFVKYFQLTTEKTTNDRGTFYVLKVESGGKTEQHQLAACDKWRGIVAHQPVKIDDSDLTNKDDVDVATRSADGQMDF